MNKRLTLNDFTGFKEFISDEELLDKANAAGQLRQKPSRNTLNFILNFSKSLEIKSTSIGKAELIMN